MDTTHARPMTAYAALCAAAVVVLAQGTSTSSSPVADAIAQAGPPAFTYAQAVTMAAAGQLSDSVREVGATIASTSVAPALSGNPRFAGVTITSGAPEKPASAPPARTTEVAQPVSIAPAVQDVGRSSSAKVHQRVAPDRKADRAATRDARKADRASAKDGRKAHRASRHR